MIPLSMKPRDEVHIPVVEPSVDPPFLDHVIVFLVIVFDRWRLVCAVDVSIERYQ